MTNSTSNQNPDQNQEISKAQDKELNFRKQEAHYQKLLEEERSARIAAEKIAQDRSSLKEDSDDDAGDDEPYIDKRVLEKKLSKFEKVLEERFEKKAEEKARRMIDDERKQNWMKNNPDFYEVMQNAQRFADKDPELAETILEMPDTFERQKLVYKNIKAFGLHKKEEPKPSIQETIDKNKKSAYYQSSGVSGPGYSAMGDFSAAGQKNAYDKLQQLKKNLRI